MYGPKRQRTVDLVRQAVDALVAAGQSVSMASVADRVLQPTGPRVGARRRLAREIVRLPWGLQGGLVPTKPSSGMVSLALSLKPYVWKLHTPLHG